MRVKGVYTSNSRLINHPCSKIEMPTEKPIKLNDQQQKPRKEKALQNKKTIG